MIGARQCDLPPIYFLSRDPLVSMTGEPYGYVSGNPLNAADPSGGMGCRSGAPCDPYHRHPPANPNQPTSGNKCGVRGGCNSATSGSDYDPNCPVALCGLFRKPDYSFATVSIGTGLFSFTVTTIVDRFGNHYTEIGPSAGPGLPVGGAQGWGWIGDPVARNGPCEQVTSPDISLRHV